MEHYIPKLELVAKEYIGLPYLDTVAPQKIAFTCWSFAHYLYTRNFTISLDSNIVIAAEKFIEIWSKSDAIDYLHDMKEWDMLCLCMNNTVVDHIGLCIYPNKIVHCKPNVGVCIEDIAKYRDQIFQIVRLQDLY